MKINKNYLKLKESYLFSDIAKRVNAVKAAGVNDIIRLGIGDVTLPLPKVCTDAMVKASEEMAVKETFRGYGEEQGYAFLRDAIRDYYGRRGCKAESDEVFVSDGAKSDLGNILDIFDNDNKILVPDPVYPVYVDTNTMDGREIVYMKGSKENGFLPMPDESVDADIIYICSPNNPTGAVYTRDMLKDWVSYAKKKGALILFDAAYEAFITEDFPRSIYEIEGARECAIEFNSFSKKAGFTGTRCGYTIVPKELVYEGASLNKMWLRRQTTKFNGVSYIIQRGAAAALSPEGEAQCSANIAYYLENARIIGEALESIGINYYGGKNSPYIWLECPDGRKSWEYFDYLLNEKRIVGTPGAGFGQCGEGFFRLTAFGSREDVKEACKRLVD
ncbi:MAG: LL-diaminopimelate aminotransferase [Lachnospiraceae bacterium]|nr:LL-diaminopimelate aminotransferase [Lachnospiraceae bacterium]